MRATDRSREPPARGSRLPRARWGPRRARSGLVPAQRAPGRAGMAVATGARGNRTRLVGDGNGHGGQPDTPGWRLQRAREQPVGRHDGPTGRSPRRRARCRRRWGCRHPRFSARPSPERSRRGRTSARRTKRGGSDPEPERRPAPSQGRTLARSHVSVSGVSVAHNHAHDRPGPVVAETMIDAAPWKPGHRWPRRPRGGPRPAAATPTTTTRSCAPWSRLPFYHGRSPASTWAPARSCRRAGSASTRASHRPADRSARPGVPRSR